MKYSSKFPRAILQHKESYVCITHPYAGCQTKNRSKLIFFLMPLDLHVLGPPLAFILSKDQTLQCELIFLPIFFLLKKNPFKLLNNVFLIINNLLIINYFQIII